MQREPSSRSSLQFTDQAISDLDQIEAYISENSPVAARRLIGRIRDICFTLAERPYIGIARPEFGSDHRSFAIPGTRYIIIYRPSGTGAEIIHVRHGSQDLSRLFE